MDPHVWATIAELWWIGPVVIAAGGLGWFGVRRERRERARRIAYDAAKLDVRAARQQLAAARTDVKVARADLATAQAERAASQGSAAGRCGGSTSSAADSARPQGGDCIGARRAGACDGSASRPPDRHHTRRPVPVGAPHGAARRGDRPLDGVRDRSGSGARVPGDERRPAAVDRGVSHPAAEAMRLRPKDVGVNGRERGTRTTAADYAAYREVLVRLERAFDAAEADAWRLARAAGTAPKDESGPRASGQRAARAGLSEWVGIDPATAAEWGGMAKDVLARSVESLTRATEAAAAAMDARRATSGTPDPQPKESGPRPSSADGAPPVDGDEPPSWPVPRRG